MRLRPCNFKEYVGDLKIHRDYMKFLYYYMKYGLNYEQIIKNKWLERKLSRSLSVKPGKIKGVKI